MYTSNKNMFVIAAVLAASLGAAGGAVAQTAKNLVCDGCVNSNDLRDETIKPRDLHRSVLFGEYVVVRANGSPAKNCTRLRSALAKIKDASVHKRVVVRLERGTFDCGTSPLAVKRHVTLEGAGRHATAIIGNTAGLDHGVVETANHSRLRNLAVAHQGAGSSVAIAILVPGKGVAIRDVAVRAESQTANSLFGIVVPGGSVSLTDVSVRAISESGGGQGIYAYSGADLDLLSTWIHNTGSAGNPAAVEVVDSTMVGFGVVLNSNIFGVLLRSTSHLELVGGKVTNVATGATFDGTKSCAGITRIDLGILDENCDP